MARAFRAKLESRAKRERARALQGEASPLLTYTLLLIAAAEILQPIVLGFKLFDGNMIPSCKCIG